MTDSHPILGVAFDIDGTLYPNRRMYRASAGIVLRNLRLFRAFGAARVAIRERYPVSDLHREVAELTAAYLHRPVEETRRRIERVIYGDWEQVLTRVPLYTDTVQTLEHLRDRGVPLAAMSDFPVVRKLEILGISRLFDHAFSAEDVGYLKPRREPFDELVSRFQLQPGSILYVGNSYRYDVVGAAGAGLRTAHLTSAKSPGGIADFRFSEYRELRAWIEPQLPN